METKLCLTTHYGHLIFGKIKHNGQSIEMKLLLFVALNIILRAEIIIAAVFSSTVSGGVSGNPLKIAVIIYPSVVISHRN